MDLGFRVKTRGPGVTAVLLARVREERCAASCLEGWGASVVDASYSRALSFGAGAAAGS